MKTNSLARAGFCPARHSIVFLTILLTVSGWLHSASAEKVVFLIGEPEYGSERTMPALAKEFGEKLGLETVVLRSDQETRKLPDLSALEDADLLVMFFRFRLATDEQFATLKKWFDAGKPAIAFRTTSHGFWENKGWFVPFFGGHYKSHADNRTGSTCLIPSDVLGHPIIRGVDGEFHLGHGGTYNAQPLSDFVTPILFGKTGDLPSEPVAWTAEYKPGQRLFYTSLGAEDNFENPSFRNMILNSALWCLNKEVPVGGVLDRDSQTSPALAKPTPVAPSRTVPKDARSLGSATLWKHWDPSVDPKAIGIDERADTSVGGPVFAGARWINDNGVFIARPGFGDIMTTNQFGDSVYRLDFLIPDEPDYIAGKFRGNSGVYIDGKWEIQIIDSHGQHTADDKNTCGAIFGVAAPSLNACGKPGTWQNMQIAVKHSSENDALISVWLNGQQIHDRVAVSDRTVYGFRPEKKTNWQNSGKPTPLDVVNGDQVKRVDMGKDFTVATRFMTKSGGPLFAKAPAEGAWAPNGKVIFVNDGAVVYDIGWLGAIAAEDVDVSDGEWHTVAVAQQSGRVKMYVDGKLEAESPNFTKPDDADHVFKVGACSTDFPDGLPPSFAGAISHTVFFDRALSAAEIVQLGAGEIDENGLAYVYENEAAGEEFEERAGSLAKQLVAGENSTDLLGGPLRLQADTSKVQFANLWVRPLADVDHSALISALDTQNFEAGKEIYDSICITCHGNLEKEGSIPTSRKFWEAEFKNGNDPHSMYLTLGNGFGQMPQFPFFSAKQRYDVIHYVMEGLVKPNNPDQYFKVTDAYLASLPKGLGEGELTDAMKEYAKGPQYLRMNFGPALNWTYQVEEGNIAYKGIAVRLDDGPGGVSNGRAWMLYDHDTMRVATAWTGNEFVDWKGIAFDGSHGTHTSIKGDRVFVNPVGPGWARPGTDDWGDPRFLGRDDKPYGPLPREWTHYKGHFLYGNRMVLSYTVGDAAILESPGLESANNSDVFTRTLNVGKASRDLKLRVAPDNTAVALAGVDQSKLTVGSNDGFIVLSIPASATPIDFKILISGAKESAVQALASVSAPAEQLEPYTKGGPESWKESVTTKGVLAENNSAYVVDTLTAPDGDMNPWNSWMRMGGFDFMPNKTSAIVCTWMGDVWRVDGISGDLSELTWTRIASGMFQPLGVIVRDDVIYVTCRDQIAELHDLNGDGEIDWYRSFNNDHQVTEHFHEFAMGLQQDAAGNFYYAKSARHALPALVEHHGTLLKVSADGSTTEILANGFRAANGVCINDDGSFFVTDQEGHWTPKNRINWVKPGGFYGNMMGYHDRTSSADEDMNQPMVWITNEMDRSPGELIWVRSGGKFGPIEGSLLNLSYGTGRIFVVPHENINGQMQGGVVQLPIPDFPTGVMRGRFHPDNGQLYACGMFAWAGNRQQAGGFYRIRYTGEPAHIPVGLNATSSGIKLTFTEPLDPKSAEDSANYKVKTWSLKRTKNYGSRHYDEKMLEVEKVTVSNDGKSVFLTLPEIEKTWSMEIKYELMAADGTPVFQRIHNTIHNLNPPGARAERQ